ncbi:hypothetical protein [Actinosynnema sp. NPDC023587]|uniref:hypothetical protein n=1 Tax=Actinosynnema sp. NPDC023587 TaxID=3154695 RepID=UPI0033EEE22D
MSPLPTHPLNWTDARVRELRNALSTTIYRESKVKPWCGGRPSAGRDPLGQPACSLWLDVLTTLRPTSCSPNWCAAARSRPVLDRRVDELLAATPPVAAPSWDGGDFRWRGSDHEQQILDGQETLLDIAFLQHGLDRARAVCLLRSEAGGRCYHGTGFRLGERTLLNSAARRETTP